jgi:uncharacterized metal-binding protein
MLLKEVTGYVNKMITEYNKKKIKFFKISLKYETKYLQKKLLLEKINHKTFSLLQLNEPFL